MAEARRNSQLGFGPMEVKGSDSARTGDVQKVDTRPELPELTLEMAKMQIGAALRRTIRVTGAALKELGDPSQVIRVCDGEVPSVLARAWTNTDRRREFIKALAQESGLFDEQVSLHERKRG